MQRQWNIEKVKQIQKYLIEKDVTIEQASKDLKFGMATFYKYKKKFGLAKPAIELKVEPYHNVLPNHLQNRKVIILITDMNSAKNLINGVLS